MEEEEDVEEEEADPSLLAVDREEPPTAKKYQLSESDKWWSLKNENVAIFLKDFDQVSCRDQ